MLERMLEDLIIGYVTTAFVHLMDPLDWTLMIICGWIGVRHGKKWHVLAAAVWFTIIYAALVWAISMHPTLTLGHVFLQFLAHSTWSFAAFGLGRLIGWRRRPGEADEPAEIQPVSSGGTAVSGSPDR